MFVSSLFGATTSPSPLPLALNQVGHYAPHASRLLADALVLLPVESLTLATAEPSTFAARAPGDGTPDTTDGTGVVDVYVCSVDALLGYRHRWPRRDDGFVVFVVYRLLKELAVSPCLGACEGQRYTPRDEIHRGFPPFVRLNDARDDNHLPAEIHAPVTVHQRELRLWCAHRRLH